MRLCVINLAIGIVRKIDAEVIEDTCIYYSYLERINVSEAMLVCINYLIKIKSTLNSLTRKNI